MASLFAIECQKYSIDKIIAVINEEFIGIRILDHYVVIHSLTITLEFIAIL